ncbi:MAG: hypothetical protein WCG47_19575 [Dermatophilaceae bacterium]
MAERFAFDLLDDDPFEVDMQAAHLFSSRILNFTTCMSWRSARL